VGFMTFFPVGILLVIRVIIRAFSTKTGHLSRSRIFGMNYFN